MSTEGALPFTTLLRCLDHQEVSELMLVSGRNVAAMRNGQLAPLTRVPVSTANILEMVANTPISQALARNEGLLEALDIELDGRKLRCMLNRRDGQVQLRIGRIAAMPKPIEPSAVVPAESIEPTPHQAHHAPLASIAPSVPPPPAIRIAADVIEPSHSDARIGPSAGPLPPSIQINMDTQPKASAPATASAQAPTHNVAPVVPSAPPVPLAPSAPIAPLVQAATVPPSASQAGFDDGAGEVVAPLGLLLEAAWRHNASDVHLVAGASMKLRRGGLLGDVGEVLQSAALEPMLLSLLAAGERQQLMSRGYVDKALPTEAGRLRINVSRNAQGIKASIRLVPYKVPSLAELGLPSELEAVSRLHQGLVVVSGPTGHGKTTTLAALVALINAHAAHHIITVEDPIEYVHPIGRALLSQRQVGLHTQSFARALKASLREDPDIIVIGELRDRETTEIALSAAETGHLVITTLNTRSASRAIDRLIDMFPPDLQTQVRTTLAGALKLVVGQKLLPTANQDGRVAAIEMISQCLPLAALIRDNKLFQLPSLMQRGRSAGMIKLDTSLIELVRAKKITADVARQNAEHPQELERALGVASASAASQATPQPSRKEV